jgi:hypothetical protein
LKGNRWAMLRLIRRAGLAELVGGRWYVGETRLREGLPEVYERVFTYFEHRGEEIPPYISPGQLATACRRTSRPARAE